MGKNDVVGQMLELIQRQRKIAARIAGKFRITDSEFVEDVIQESMLIVLQGKAAGFDPSKGSLAVYVTHIVLHVAIRLAMASRRQTPLPEHYDAEARDDGPVIVAIRNEEIAEVETAIARLPKPDRSDLRRGLRRHRRRQHRRGSLRVLRTSTGHVRFFRAKDRLLQQLIDVRRERRTRPIRRKG